MNPTIIGTGGMTAEIFITGLSETDTVTCTKDGKVKQGKWVNSKTVMHHDTDTLLLLHGEEFTDSAVSDHGITSSGAVISSDQHKFGEKSFYFNGSSYLYTIVDSNLNLGSEDFTVECWVYQTVLSGYPRIFDYTTNDFHLEINNSGQVYWKIGSVTSTSSTTVPLNKWNHIALVRNGTTVTCYLNGTSICSSTVSGSLPITVGGKLAIGYGLSEGATNYLKGYIDEFRISKVARWTANFTPPTEPYSNTVAVTKSGWLFNKLKEYGTYTITATNGTDTVTQDVLVDMATEFDIEMSYIKDRLLTSDDFQNGTFKNGTHSILTNQENGTDGIRLVGAASRVYNNQSLDAYIRLDMAIDFTDYSKLKFKAKKVVDHGVMLVVVTDGLKNTSKSWDDAFGNSSSSTYTEPLTVAYVGVTKSYKELTANVWNDYEIDVSNITGEHVLSFVGGYTDLSGYSSSETNYCDIWLMK